MRGNPYGMAMVIGDERSIPARAGEPTDSGIRLHALKVYPRACGGTHPVRRIAQKYLGLSPRVRGNPTFQSP